MVLKIYFRYINILTDFVDAEIFLIDGDSLLLELLGERSLDWNNGGQFLHLTYLLERFLQYFTDKGELAMACLQFLRRCIVLSEFELGEKYLGYALYDTQSKPDL